jgi:hypothetical protein
LQSASFYQLFFPLKTTFRFSLFAVVSALLLASLNPLSAATLGLTNLVVGPAAGANSVVLAATHESWTASNNATWLHLRAENQAGNGSSTVIFSYDANPDITSRTGTITIAGLTLTITQGGSGYLPATSALLFGTAANGVYLAVDTPGNVYLEDINPPGAIWEWNAVDGAQSILVSGMAEPGPVSVDQAGIVTSLLGPPASKLGIRPARRVPPSRRD